jgi:hypothetical protein
VVLERLSDISVVCSQCCLMVQDHVTCMFMLVELWNVFEALLLSNCDALPLSKDGQS